MEKLLLLLSLLVASSHHQVQAGWVWIDGHNFWIPNHGEPNYPPAAPNGADLSSFRLTRHAKGWQLDPKHAPNPGPSEPGIGDGMVPGQAEAIANGVNFVAGFIGQDIPVASYDGLHRAQKESELKAQEYEKQAQDLADLIRRLDGIPPISSSSSSPYATSTDKVSTGLNKWVDKKVTESVNSISNQLRPHYETTDLFNEISRWKDFSVAKKQVLLMVGEYSSLSDRRHSASTLSNEFQSYADIAIQSGLESLTDAAEMAGGTSSGSFSDYFEVSKSTLEIAKSLLDVGLSLTPGISVGKDAYEALTGKSLIDGSQLDLTSRSFAVLGVATAGGSNIVKSSFKGLVKIAEAAHLRGVLTHGFESAIKLTESNLINIVRHTPINQGVLHTERIGEEIAREFQAMTHISDTFRSGTYHTYQTTQSRYLYRVASVDASKLEDVAKVLNKDTTWAHKSSFWTSIPPLSPTQGMIDSALERSWGSSANVWIKIKVPAGEVMHEGTTAGIQRIGNNMSEFVGGGNQIYLKPGLDGRVPKEWIEEIGRFVE